MKPNKHPLYLYIPLFLAVTFLIWWLAINFFDVPNADNFADSISVVALTGSIAGFIAGKKWGLFKSKFGSSIGFFSLGLLMQFLGLLIYTLYFRVKGVELAFPNIGDVPLLLTSVFYTLGAYSLLKVIVFNNNPLKPMSIFFISTAVTIGLLSCMWLAFLRFGINDDRGTVYSILNVAYPLTQAFYFLIGLVAVLQAKRMSGGKMLKPVLIMLVALIVLYAADFVFLYQSYKESWQPASTSDLLYVTGFGLMALAILAIDHTRRMVAAPSIKNDSKEGLENAG